MTSFSSGRFSRAHSLIRLARPHFLVTGVLLYTLGTLLAMVNGAAFELNRFVLGYLIFLFAHVSMHFSNDYFDREGDAAAQRTSVSGGSGVLVEHPEIAPLALGIAVALLAASVLTAIAFTLYYSYSLTFLVFAVLGGLLGWFYTAPPLRFAYRGLGEASTALAVGFVMPGMGYLVTSGTIDRWFVLLSLPLVFYGLFFILTVEMPDIDSDRAMGRVNLLVERGITTGTRVALLATGAATVVLFAIAYSGVLGTLDVWPLAWFSLVPVTMAAYGALRDMRQRDKVLSQVKLNFVSILSMVLFFVLVSLAAVW